MTKLVENVGKIQNGFFSTSSTKITDKILVGKEHRFTPIPIRPIIFVFGLSQSKLEPEP